MFTAAEAGRRLDAMRRSQIAALGKDSPWSNDIKASDEFLEPLFRAYFGSSACELVEPPEIDAEIREKLDTIARDTCLMPAGVRRQLDR